MFRTLLVLALISAVPASADAAIASPMHLTLEQETALHCSAVFAIISREQAQHAPVSETLPHVGARGREYFVVTTAQLIDQTSATHQQVAALFKSRHAQALSGLTGVADPVTARAAMLEPCLVLLAATLGKGG